MPWVSGLGAGVKGQGSRVRGQGSGAETSLALGVRPDRAKEVDLAELGPQGLTEVELAHRALPQQESAHALLPRGADTKVRGGLAHGVAVFPDPGDVTCLSGGRVADPSGSAVHETGRSERRRRG